MMKLEMGDAYVHYEQRNDGVGLAKQSWEELELGKKKPKAKQKKSCGDWFKSVLNCGRVTDVPVDEGDFVIVKETLQDFGTDEPNWDPTQMTMSDLCNNNKLLPIRLTVKSYTN